MQQNATTAPASVTQNTTKIRIRSGDTVLAATLDDSIAGRDFASLLPLTIDLADYHATEKISDLPRRLKIDGAPDGIDPAIGDITYYAPWGNLAIFYKDFGFSRGLIHLGKIDSGVEALTRPGAKSVTIERVP